ncbi:hypothetical protein ZYGR_0P02840 [Zygosaccharomyces rouxii]|uniref:ZYRO0E07172p n=2 Tax=Zygosaccharomyces rouxii TaxID=4956 RepID=C5E4L9_ZYGRC|nr:uncharacterized protein ZYRO0E07172g [Zygosaccharomyces rouxii]KAH9198164.1 hypothetical protein LQ764DRAFT_154854 [Zygosaccharomyces rouxii]GAV49639.1 hypothetical protein ZYGR_0P02840 [Zygosaccharomyces rouxii]CAR30980.1 ZYRO0E07172p [Zygosaccharomyces rouxii]
MTGGEFLSLPRRRTTGKSVNYNEKEADAEMAKRIEQLEEARASNKSSKPKKGRGGGIATNCSPNSTDKIKYQKFLNDKSIGWNFIPSVPPFFRKASRFSTILDLENAYVDIEEQSLYNPDSVLIKANDTIYMVSEPPGEPYYIGRVVEFVSKPEFRTIISKASKDVKKFPVKFFQVRMNWFYRSRDIQNRLNNVQPRLIYASLHQDVCPIESYRGKCTVVHQNDINTVAVDKFDFLTRSNNFYFSQLFDRYTRKYYKVITTDDLLKLQSFSPFLVVLNRRFRYLFVEENYPLEEIIEKYILKKDEGAKKDDELWSDRCSICREWCSKSMSLKCEECTQAVHLYCLDTPLDRKPNKGVVWFCFKCIKKQEGSEEALKELEKDQLEEKEFFDSSRQVLNEVAQKELREGNFSSKNCCWFQYAGQTMVNHLKDLMYEHLSLPYPMKFSRVGSRYQWSGCNNEEESTSRSYSPDFQQEERGTDTTSQLLWDMKNSKTSPDEVDRYVERCKAEYPPKLNMLPESCNFLDLAVTTLMKNDFDTELAFKKCGELASRESLQEPTFTPEEVKQFEDAIAEFGSELHPVSERVKTQPSSMIVRYYYHWKKTPNGKRIWGNFKGRKKNIGREQLHVENLNSIVQREERKSKRDRKPTKLALESESYKSQEGWKYLDDSSFETENAPSLKPCFQCMFCEIDYSPMWYKVTGGSDDDYIKKRMQTGVNEKTETSEKNLPVTKGSKSKDKENKDKKLDALCIRCARIWRRYGVEWQPPLTVLKRLNGPSAASLYATLELVFNETNNNVLKLSSQQAHNKCLEWELVQDSELITRQRGDMISVPERLTKLKKSSMAARMQLYKMVKRPFDKAAWSKDRMLSDLQKYLEQQQPKKPKVIPTINNIVNDPNDIAQQDRPRANKTDTTKKNESSNKVEPKKEQVFGISDELKQNLSSNGDLQVHVPLNGGDCGKITLDSEAKYLQLDEKIYGELNSRLDHSRKRFNSDDLSQGSHQKKRLKSHDGLHFSKDFKTWNSKNISVITDEKDTARILNMYHQLDPFQSNFSHEHQPENGSEDSMPIQKSVSIEGNSFQSDFEKPKDFCNVCGESFDQTLDEEINCYSCGLSVHYYCYGVKIPADASRKRKLKFYKWYCDPCSNEIHPIVSTNYKCDLCYVKKFEDSLCRGHLDCPDPNALKCTTSGSWCHILCAVFNPDIKFGCATNLQPVINANHVIAKNIGQVCSICKLEGGGPIKCSLCSIKFHITCARSTPGFYLKMMMIKSTNIIEDKKIIRGIYDEEYSITPVALCGNHQSELHEIKDFYPLNWKMDENSKTLLQLYCENYKENPRMSTVSTRYLEQQSIWGENLFDHLDGLEQGKMARELAINSEKDKLIKNEVKICSNCGTDRSIFWYDQNICHACHISPKLGKFNANMPTQDQVGPRISKEDAAKVLDVLMPMETVVKNVKEEKKVPKSLTAKGSSKKTKWVKETPGP